MKEETKMKISYKLRGRKKGATHRKRIAQAMKIIWKKRKEEKL